MEMSNCFHMQLHVHVHAAALCTVGFHTAQKFAHVSAFQKSVLQESFAENAYPRKVTLCKLAAQLGLSDSSGLYM